VAKKLGWQFAVCSPAQFEELGDLHGLPMIENGRTVFAPPDWVPTRPGPGILLVDDINRADDRILRGLMQLFQLNRMFSWSLPPGWQIVATANPDGGDYSVTPMDDALITRFTHLTLIFEARSWARWAEANGVDRRGIAFVLCHPELVNHRRTTPRTLTQFFEQLKNIPDLLAERELIYILGLSTLEESTVAAFISFLQDSLPSLPDAESILNAPEPQAVSQLLDQVSTRTTTRRMDRLGAICSRLLFALSSPDYQPQSHHRTNLLAFFLHPTLPQDLRLTLHRDLLKECSPKVAELLRDPALARLVLDGL
jgi:hypothetical protein